MQLPDIDPRLAKWPLMEDTALTNIIIISYLMFVKIIGPSYMQKRKPYNLRTLMILYNFFMVGYSAWMFYEFGKHGWFTKYSWVCESVNLSEDEDSMGMVRVCWFFFISKFVELLDTIFFILRKKDGQVTGLHVTHHALVPWITRFLLVRGAGGYSSMPAFINSFIHIWMYLYYGLSAIGPSWQKYLWWKKYLTTLQIMQFCLILVYMTLSCLLPGCDVNMAAAIIHIGVEVLFLVLFLKFYSSSYKKKKLQ